MAYFFPDTTVLVNFALVDQLRVLEAHLGGTGRITQAMAAEVRKSSNVVPNLHKLRIDVLFGPAIELQTPEDRDEVELIRTARFGGDSKRPLQHLGESETLVAIQRMKALRDSVLITDDHDAFSVARRFGITAQSTVSVLRDAVSFGALQSHAAYEFAVTLTRLDRKLIDAPRSVEDLVA